MAAGRITYLQSSWTSKFGEEGRNDRHLLPKLVGRPILDYERLKMLCNIDGLGERLKPSTPEAHNEFMKNYPKMFKNSQTLPPNLLEKKMSSRGYKNPLIARELVIPHDKGLYPHWCPGFDKHLCSHNISHHMSKLHKHDFVITSATSVFNARIKSIRKILKKMPFERKAKENEALYKHLISLPEISDQVEPDVLKELCSVAHLDKWSDEDCTVFGNTGLHMVLKGSVVPQTKPCLSPVSSPSREFRSPTPVFEHQELKQQAVMTVGNCFGTLKKIEGREPNTRVLSVITLEPCEFLKISTHDYGRVIQMNDSREKEEKLSLAQTCKLFGNWPRQSLKTVSGLIKWRRFLPGQVLAKEGERCEIIGFIKKGACLLRKMVTVAHTFPNGSKEKRKKQVIIGRLGPGDSFGEATVLKNSVMPCAVVTDSIVEIGSISTLDVYDLDDITKSLLIQSYSEFETSMTEAEIENEYIEQEKSREWTKFKQKVLGDVLFYCEIQPGVSKWSRNPLPQNVES